MSEEVSILNKTKGTLSHDTVPFDEYKNKILGKNYELSIVYVGEKFIQNLNKKYRKINKPTDILSFSLEKNSGEIFFCEKIAEKKAREFERTPDNFVKFLFIHGMVHLLGYDHGNKMESLETRFRRFFAI